MWDWIKALVLPIKSIKIMENSDKNSTVQIGKKAIDLILEFEGVDQPWRRPPGDSGITIGYGFDLGYCSQKEFDTAWRKYFSENDFRLLSSVIGKKGSSAESQESMLTKVKPVSVSAAREVFDRCTIPKWGEIAAKTFPGIQQFSPNQQGALVSLVFNRGASLEGSRRTEMKSIREIIESNLPIEDKSKKIVSQFRAMQRIWPSNNPSSGHPGLRRRRRAEADLFEMG